MAGVGCDMRPKGSGMASVGIGMSLERLLWQESVILGERIILESDYFCQQSFLKETM